MDFDLERMAFGSVIGVTGAAVAAADVIDEIYPRPPADNPRARLTSFFFYRFRYGCIFDPRKKEHRDGGNTGSGRNPLADTMPAQRGADQRVQTHPDRSECRGPVQGSRQLARRADRRARQ